MPNQRATVLHLATHNVRGLAAKVATCCRIWRQLRCDVVVVTETHLTVFTRATVERHLRDKGWTPFLCDGTSHAGVAVLLRTDLVSEGALTLRPGQRVRMPVPGRVLYLPLQWRGWALDLVGVYLPASDYAASALIIEQALAPLLRRRPAGRLLLAGDWNFVHDRALDRRSSTAAGLVDELTRDRVPADAFARHLPGMVDAWRAQHGARQEYTHFHTSHASRIDRVYVPQTMLPSVLSTAVDGYWAVSDHRLVSTRLLSMNSPAFGEGIPRIPLLYLQDPACVRVMEAWLRLRSPPSDPQELVDRGWLGRCMTDAKRLIAALNKVARRRVEAAQPRRAALATARQVLQDASNELVTGSDACMPATLAAVAQAQAEVTRLLEEEEAAAQVTRKQRFVHQGERPGPVLSKVMRPPASSQTIRALRAPGSGHIVRAGRAMAGIINGTFAQVSAAQALDPAARAEVLAAVAAGGPAVAPDLAAALGSRAVSAQEVKDSITGLAPNKAGGLDGMRGEFYRAHVAVMASLLAAQYSAIGALGRTPAGFLDGAIKPLYKPGNDPLLPTSYRPLQLLGYEYRILTRVLASRLSTALAGIVGHTQTAFLPERNIGDSLCLLRAAPSCLAAEGRMALVAFLDFRKAYDTVDRDFLYAAAGELGLGDGLLRWMRTLHTGTYTRAVVNGWASDDLCYQAGVRQGCPLAPALYLCVAEALQRFLAARGLGVTVAGQRLVASQYADDVQVFLRGPEDVPLLLQALEVFGNASGQRLNADKTQLMPVGHRRCVEEFWAAHPPEADGVARVGGLCLVRSATVLGIDLQGSGGTSMNWPAAQKQLQECGDRVARITDLSAFGRAFAISGYGISRLLYAVQHSAVPSGATQWIRKRTAALVSAGLPSAGSQRRKPGFPAACLAAHPRDGGLGLLPINNHILSRWASAGARLLASDPLRPWVALMRRLVQLHLLDGDVGPAGDAVGVWALLTCAEDSLYGAFSSAPPVLRSHARALRFLPPLQDVAQERLRPGEWCWHAPLWCCPHPSLTVLADPWVAGGPNHVVRVGLETKVPSSRRGLPGWPHTVGELEYCLYRLEGATDASRHPVGLELARIRPLYRSAFPGWPSDWDEVRGELRWLRDRVPASWLEAARDVRLEARINNRQPPQCTASSIAAVHRMLTARLGWRLQRPLAVVKLQALTVAEATKLQRWCNPAVAEITRRHARCRARVAHIDGVQASALPDLGAVAAEAWALRVPNTVKETYWRLLLDSFPTSQRMDSAEACPACGATGPGVRHYFWDCPVAVAVRGEVAQQLWPTSGSQAGRRLKGAHLWLTVLPRGGVPALVWRTVCLAAVVGLDKGRRVAWSMGLDGRPPDEAVGPAARAAIAAFWSTLAEATLTLRVPILARTPVLQASPFLQWHEGKLWVVRGDQRLA